MLNADERPPLARRWLVLATFAALLTIAVVVAANAPANWLALYVASATRGVVLLADARGTIWSGNAIVALGAPQPSNDSDTAATDRNNSSAAGRLALPGRVTWALELTHALAPVLHLTDDGVLLQPVAVRGVARGLSFDAGSAVLPAAILRLIGAPLNTLLPEGRCTLHWNALRIDRDGELRGDGTLRVDGFALALSPVRPLGDYLVAWTSGATGLTWQLATERGPLALEGNGSVAGSRIQARVTLRAAADAAPGDVARLGPLLDTIGRNGPSGQRGHDEAVIRVGGP